MKLRKFFALALASTLFVACDNDDNQSIDSGNGPGQEGDAWVALSINTKGSGNQLRSQVGEDPGTPDESKINKVYAIFFDGFTDASNVTAAIELSSGQMGTPGSSTGLGGEAFKIPATSKSILVVVNPAANFTLPALSTKYETVNTALQANVLDLTAGSNSPIKNGFMMTNAKGGLEPSESDGTPKDLKLYKTELEAAGTPLSINVDRVVAKVRVNIKTVSDNATISAAEWVLNVTNKTYFPVSVRTKTQLEKDGGPGFTPAPYDQYKLGSYRIDPNYLIGDQAGAYNLQTTADNATWIGTGVSQYCLENTQEASANKQAYTTQAVIRAKYMPKEFEYPDGSKETVAAAKSWMRIGNGYYSALTLEKWIKKELYAKYLKVDELTPNSEAEADAVTTVITTALKTYLKTVSGDITLPGFVTKKEDVDDLVTSFMQSLNTNAVAKAVGSFTYYTDAFSYYKVMIKHDNLDQDDFINQLGEFGVVRNSVYDINVNKFNNPGYPVIPTPGDEDDEDDLQWIAVQININPWTWYSQDIEF